MKKNNKFSRSERGQALIIIVFAIIGLIALTALTVDGGNAYSNRRNAQNAADTAAFAAARAKVRVEDWKQAALVIAAENGYTDTDHTSASSSTKSNVEVYQCSESGVDCNIIIQPGETLQDYIQVKITSIVDTFFAPVIGIRQVTNRVNAIVRVKNGTNQPIGAGSALFSLNPDGCASVTYQGNAAVTLVGSGIYVNSSCPASAFFNQSSSPNTNLTTPCIQAVGGIQYAPGSVVIDPPTTPACILTDQPPLPPPTMPQPTCATNAIQSGNTLSPGNWSGAFPPSGVTNLQTGLYCVDAGNQNFRLNANDVLVGKNVTIYMITGGVTWNGQATVKLEAPDSGPYKGLLLYLPPANSNPVSINGGGDSKIVGTILAPASECSVLGGGGLNGLQTQLICYDLKLGGGSDTTIVYDSALQYNPPSLPTIELTK